MEASGFARFFPDLALHNLDLVLHSLVQAPAKILGPY